MFKDAYNKPGKYRVQARVSESRSDSNSNIELWIEDGEVTGMGVEATVLPDGEITVVGFIDSGTGNPPPKNS